MEHLVHPSAKMVQNRTWHEKNTLFIRLTESVVFLRTSDPTGRDRVQDNAPPAMVRGLLTLNIVRPTRISSIEIELQGKATTSSFEGACDSISRKRETVHLRVLRGRCTPHGDDGSAQGVLCIYHPV